MKYFIIISIILTVIINGNYAQVPVVNHTIPLIGEDIPAFKAETTQGVLNFPSDFGKSWKILFSHPADFTPFCTSEILQLALMQKEFNDLDVRFAILSTDPLDLHLSWERSMNDLLEKSHSGVRIEFPLIDDHDQTISNKYGMISPSVDSRRTVRGVFIISPDNKVAAICFYPNNVGRNMEEIKRTVIALQVAKDRNVITPVNWEKGDDVLVPYPYPPEAYDKMKTKEGSYRNLTWYMLFKKLE